METAKEKMSVNKNQFFDALENDNQLLSETLDVILQLVISDPELTSNVAEHVKDEYPALSKAITGEPDKAEDKDLPGCCRQH